MFRAGTNFLENFGTGSYDTGPRLSQKQISVTEQKGYVEIKIDNITEWILYLLIETDIFARLEHVLSLQTS